MSGDAFTHTETVRLIEEAFGRFSSRVLAALPGPVWRADSAASMLADREGQLRACVSEHEADAEAAESEEDGDGSAHRAAADQAREEIARIRSVRTILDAARARYQRESRVLERMGEDNAAQARQFLRGVQDDLQAYLSKDVEPGGIGIASAGSVAGDTFAANPPHGAESDAAGAEAAPDPARFPLPKGFTWLPLSTIESTDDLVGPDAWQKVSHEQMQRGFKSLQRDVLKTFQMFGTGAGRDWFRAQDQAKGRSYEDGLECVFDAFFGDNPIAISRTDGGNTHGITNGRHRIAIARELGWSAVPVVFTDQPRQ